MRKMMKKVLVLGLSLSLLAGLGAVASFAFEYLESSEENQGYIVREDLSLYILGKIPTKVGFTAAIIRDDGKFDKIVVIFENKSMQVVKIIKEERTPGVLRVPRTLFNEYGERLVLNIPENIEVETVENHFIADYIAI